MNPASLTMLPRIVTALLCIVGLVTSANALANASGTPVCEGLLDFKIPSTGEIGNTWYRIIGKLKPGVRPLIALHGGPGVNSGYLEALAPVTQGCPGPLIVYDQIGNGKSTHYPERMGNTTFWTTDLFVAELDNVLTKLKITEYDLIGHSWGAMLAAMHAVRRPKGLKHLVLWSGPASMPLWIQAQNTWISQLPPPIRDVLIRGEETGETDTEEYENASNYFYSKHFCRLDPFPASLLEGFAAIENDPTVYLTM
jgi:proline-specific peptidase